MDTATLIEDNLSEQQENNQQSNTKDLLNFAYCGSKEFFNFKLKELKDMAEEENWSTNGDGTLDRLYHYIMHTFSRCLFQNKISYSEQGDYAVFNTGLLTDNSEQIIGFFGLNTPGHKEKWKFIRFVKESSRDITNNFDEIPNLASYTDDYADFYFDAKKQIIFNADHILDDNWERYPEQIKSMGKQTVAALIRDGFEIARKKIARNNRLVVPQFYNNQIMYLMPISIHINNQKLLLALAIEKTTRGKYRANTIFTIEMAYPKARLIMKPESNWLIN